MRSVYSLPSNLEKLTRKQLERRKENTQKRIEELEIGISISVSKMMDIVNKQDELKKKLPLLTYPPLKADYDAKYNELEQKRNAENKNYQDLKHEIDTLHYNIGELDIAINTIQELVEQYDE
jgi:predicted  nucleic acid-binding Zn-ribbon protein